jgi:CRISPR/Cas system Type II protein with McrA/HNH and RuvC-like nuclease domain
MKNTATMFIKIYSKTKGKCYYCGLDLLTDLYTVDHLTPKSKGGNDEIDNLVPSCRYCNSSKGTKTVEEFRTRKEIVLGMSFTEAQYKYWSDRDRGLTLPVSHTYEFWFEKDENHE